MECKGRELTSANDSERVGSSQSRHDFLSLPSSRSEDKKVNKHLCRGCLNEMRGKCELSGFRTTGSFKAARAMTFSQTSRNCQIVEKLGIVRALANVS